MDCPHTTAHEMHVLSLDVQALPKPMLINDVKVAFPMSIEECMHHILE